MSRSIRLLPLITIALLAGCSSPPQPQAAAPSPASEATDLRDTIQRPIDKAKGVEDIIMKSHDHQDRQLNSAEGDGADASSPASQ